MRSDQVVGLPVIHIDLGRRFGVVQELILDPKARRVAGLVVKTAGWRGRGLLPIERVYALGCEAVTVDDEGAVQNLQEQTPLRALWQRRLGLEAMPVLTVSGRGLGTVAAYEFGADGTIETVYLQRPRRGRRGRPSLPGRLVRSFGEDAVIVSDEAEAWVAAGPDAAPAEEASLESSAAGRIQNVGPGARLLAQLRAFASRGGAGGASGTHGKEASTRGEND